VARAVVQPRAARVASTSGLNGIPGESANTFWLRLVTPFWRVIPRVSLPIQVVPAPNPTASVAKVTGIGDLNVFATFVVTPDDSKAMVGVGPIYTAPTANWAARSPDLRRPQHAVQSRSQEEVGTSGASGEPT